MRSKSPSVVLVALAAASLGLQPGCGYDEVDFTMLTLEPESIDPSLASGVPDSRIVRALFCGLTSSHPETLADLPELAERWETSEDGLTWTFHLRDAQWSDGRPVAAADFIWTYERVLDPASESKFLDQFFVIANAEEYNRGQVTDFAEVGVRAPDAKTVVFELEAPVPFFTQLTSFAPFYPVPPHAVEERGESFWTKPGKIVTSGPFVLDEWRFRERIVMRKNPLYWDAQSVRLNSVAAVAADSENTGFSLYETGLAEWAEKVHIPVAHLLDDLKGRPDFHITDYLGTYYISVNTTYPPFDDPRVRRAFSLALKRDVLVERVPRSGERPATGFVYPDMPGYEPPRTPTIQEDADEARRLLAEAGFPGGQGFPYVEYLYNTNERHKAIGEYLQNRWREVLGVQVELRNVEWQVYLESMRRLEHKGFARSGWIGDYLDASTFLRLMTSKAGNNYTGYANPEYDALMATALREPDPDARLRQYQELESMVLRDLPLIPLYFYVQVKLIKPYVKGDPGNLQDKLMLKWVWVDTELKRYWLEHGRLPPTAQAEATARP